MPGKRVNTLRNADQEKFDTGRRAFCMATALTVLLGSLARAADLDATTNLSGSNEIPLANGTQNVVHNPNAVFGGEEGSGPGSEVWTGGWDFGDRLGNGGNEAVEPPGLFLGHFDLAARQNYVESPLRLNLAGGDIASVSGSITTDNAAAGRRSGDIVIHHVGHIALNDGHLSIRRANYAVGRYVHIGEPLRPAKSLQAAFIDANSTGGSDSASPVDIRIYAEGDVRMENDDGSVAGDLLGAAQFSDDESVWVNVGTRTRLRVRHHGRFRANRIAFGLSSTSSGRDDAEPVEFDGAAYGNRVPQGPFVAGELNGIAINRSTGSVRNIPSNPVHIRNYTAVEIGRIALDTLGNPARANSGHAGDTVIADILGDIAIADTVSAWNADPARRGGLVLHSLGGRIRIGRLDLARIAYAIFDSGAERSTITGPLDHFDPAPRADNGGDGSLVAPWVTAQTALRTPSGQRVYYAVSDGYNLGLEGRVFRIADPDGVPGQGGLLMQEPGPAILTAEPDAIHTNRAVLRGELIAVGESSPSVAVHWTLGDDRGTDPAAWPESHHFGPHVGETPSPYTHAVEALAPGTRYTYRYVATDPDAIDWGEPISFTTWQAPSAPILESDPGYDWNSAEIRGAAASGVPDPDVWLLLHPGFDPGTSGTGAWQRAVHVGTVSNGFATTVSGLQSGTAYHVRAYAENVVGGAWSEPMVFETLAIDPHPLLDAAGITGGIVVHLGSDQGQRAAALASLDRFLVHGLDPDAESVETGRARLQSMGRYGRASIERHDGATLPYADRMVNWLIVDDFPEVAAVGLAPEEMVRVLVPGGVALLGEADATALQAALPEAAVSTVQTAEGEWVRVVKPWPPELDDWTHFRYDSTRRATSSDNEVAPIQSLRWIDGPGRARTHTGRPHGAVVANGRFFYIQDKARPFFNVPADLRLVARDAFNGVVLWTRPVQAIDRSSASSLPRATLAARGDRVYATLDAGRELHVIDAATGLTLDIYGTADDLAILEDTLLVVDQSAVRRMQADTGAELWVAEGIAGSRGRSCLATDGERVYVRNSVAGKTYALRLSDGAVLWERDGGSALICGVQDGRLVLGASSEIIGVCAASGTEVWRHAYGRSGRGSAFNVYFSRGLVWANDADDGVWFALDPQTGALQESFASGFTDKCAPGRATQRFLVTGRTDFFCTETGQRASPHVARGACGYPGVLPAHGLVYTFPTDCQCYAMLYANVAMAPAPVARDSDPETELETGPAYDRPYDSGIADDHDWPTYRRDGQRSAATNTDVPAEMHLLWSVPAAPEHAPALTPPVIADGRVFAAATDAHQVLAFDAATGAALWSFTAGGRIPMPPAWHAGRVLFGSEDGWVYALDAADGTLAWRRRIAPGTGRIFAYGRLASAWPVLGGVLIDQGYAYAVAGRHGPLDGGARAVKLDPQTGHIVWDVVPDGANHVDLLVKGEENIYMWNGFFNPQTGAYTPGSGGYGRATLDEPILFAPATFLTGVWSNRTRWRKEGENAPLVAFNHQVIFSVQPFQDSDKYTAIQPGMGHFRLYGKPVGGGEIWSRSLPIETRAMLVAGDRLFVGGPPDEWPASGGLLAALDAQSGEPLAQRQLDSAPVRDGLAAAHGTLFLSAENGHLLNLGKREDVALTLDIGPGGTVTGPDGDLFAYGSEIALIAEAEPYHYFVEWLGDVTGNPHDPTLTLLMDRPRNVSARFAPHVTASTGTPLWWLALHGLADNGAEGEEAALRDSAAGSFKVWEAFVANICPTNPAAAMPALLWQNGQLVIVPSSAERDYVVDTKTNLLQTQWRTWTNRPGTGASMTFPTDPYDRSGFFRYRIRLLPY